MKSTDIIDFYLIQLVILMLCFSNLILGGSSDKYLSDYTLKKLSVPKKSFLRKLVIFKENRFTVPDSFLYIRVIPYLIEWLFTIIGTILILINQFVVYFIPSSAFLIFGYCNLGLYFAYEILLMFLGYGIHY